MGSTSFDVSEVPLSGAPDELACLSLLETYWERPACQVHPEPGVACPQFIRVVDNYSVLASAMLTTPSPSQPVSTEPPQLPPPTATQSPIVTPSHRVPIGISLDTTGGTVDMGALGTRPRATTRVGQARERPRPRSRRRPRCGRYFRGRI